jgi:membrane protease subunit (stomatin/prohibitin family)
MQDAAKNANGAAMGFMGMNMAGQAGGFNAANLYAMGSQQPVEAHPAPAPKASGWTCPSCGKEAFGKFCPECGTKKPEDGWVCPSCGTVNKGKFCAECGAKKPADGPLYKCNKCGWEPDDPAHPPKFCPQCGDPIDENDIVR